MGFYVQRNFFSVYLLSMFWPGKVMLAKLDINIGLNNNNNKIK